MKNVYILTPNLLIREISPIDCIALEEIRQAVNEAPQNIPYYALKYPGDAEKFCHEALEQQQVVPRQTLGLAVCMKEEKHKMIGFVIGELIELDKEDWGGQKGLGDIGYFMHPSYQGKGYVTEAVRALMSRIFFEDLGYEYLSATVHPKNILSQKVLKNLGFQSYGETQKYGGEPRILLKVTKDDFYKHKNFHGENKNLIVARQAKIIKGFLQYEQQKD